MYQDTGEERSEQRLRKRRNQNIEERKAFQGDDGHNCQMSQKSRLSHEFWQSVQGTGCKSN